MNSQNSGSLISKSQQSQFARDGFFIIEAAISKQQLVNLREEAQRFVEIMDAEMDAAGETQIGISFKGNRYFIGNKFEESSTLRAFLFSDLMAEICRATLGENAFLFNEQFVLKAAEKGMAFGWHQDSGYVGHPHRPYLSCWCALDDMTIENGTVSLLTYQEAGTREFIPHSREENSSEMIGYRGENPGAPAIVPAGSIAVFSSTVFHRSGVNTTDKWRRVYLAQYSAEPILKEDGSGFWGHAVPFLENGENILARHYREGGNP